MKVKISLKEYESHVESMRLKSMAIREEYFARQQELNKKIEELNRREKALSQEARDFVGSKTDEELLDLFLPEKTTHKKQYGVREVEGFFYKKEVPVFEEIEVRTGELPSCVEGETLDPKLKNLLIHSFENYWLDAEIKKRFKCMRYLGFKSVDYDYVSNKGSNDRITSRKLSFFVKHPPLIEDEEVHLFDKKLTRYVGNFVTHLNNFKKFNVMEIELDCQTLEGLRELQEQGGWESEIRKLERREDEVNSLLGDNNETNN